MRKPRHLSPQERALWDHVASQATPIKKQAATGVEPELSPTLVKRQPEKTPSRPFRVGSKIDHHQDHDLLPSLTQQLKTNSIQMDAKAHSKMKRGKTKPEARIDLHGMTVAQAHSALTGFILTEQAAGSRLLLVITGKGRPRTYDASMSDRHGILRHQVPQWLNLPPLRNVVLQVTSAHIRHGGGGAYYVYLRRTR